MSVSSSIDWNMALEQVRGDQGFLKEILGDLMMVAPSTDAGDAEPCGLRYTIVRS